MTADDFDIELLLLFPFGIATAVSLGLIEAATIPLIDLSQVLLSAGSIDITVARAASIGIIAALIANRDAGIRDTSGIDLWIAYATIGLVLAPPFVPFLQDVFLGGTFASLIAWIGQGIGAAMISYTN